MNELDISYDVITGLLDQVSKKILPSLTTVQEILDSRQQQPSNIIKTRLVLLDLFLRGGIQHDHITEIVGASGVGKTQFCQMITILATLPIELGGLGVDSTVLYFDSDKACSTQRLYDMALALEPDYFSIESNIVNFLERVIIVNVSSSNDLVEHLEGLEEKIISRNIKLVIVDSIASIVRKEFDSSAIYQRQQLLSKEASLLKYIAETFHIPVVLTNQVTTVTTSVNDIENTTLRYVTAALGTLWSHCVNTRLVLEKNVKGFGERVYRMVIAKSPVSPVVLFPFTIATNGLNLIRKSDEEMVSLAQDLTEEDHLEEIDYYYMEYDSSNFWDQTITS